MLLPRTVLPGAAQRSAVRVEEFGPGTANASNAPVHEARDVNPITIPRQEEGGPCSIRSYTCVICQAQARRVNPKVYPCQLALYRTCLPLLQCLRAEQPPNSLAGWRSDHTPFKAEEGKQSSCWEMHIWRGGLRSSRRAGIVLGFIASHEEGKGGRCVSLMTFDVYSDESRHLQGDAAEVSAWPRARAGHVPALWEGIQV